MRILLAAVALLAATPAFATDWKWAGLSSDTAVLADRDSMTRPEGGTVQVRLVYVLDVDVGGIAALDALAEFDCANRRTRRLKIDGRDAQGEVVKSQTPSPDWHAVPQGDLGAAVFDFVCDGTARAADYPAATGSLPEMIAAGRRMLQH